ncbi:hypothetical protein [Vibrio cholerae]|uniref:hypothetical protein n=1 Tax=Vibrio cholerae TaxID=666 RepID=UPI002A2CD5DC|nr:hypothetical protein [Vibrio cholerae]EGQ8442979.1 hypothetical protein [Vibrio cholerae]EGR1308646.1 hypothetical protein [Vibrio cholerae]EJL6421900.1 hypothetical protein [Vibrio cholerae]EJL6904619.1 hypothetical protein [Vibrio cholerae]EJL6977938.1 hypothetical protein [Vibrio cholerae]
MLDIQDIQSRKAREQTLHKAGVGTCTLAWQVGFFFDGMLRNVNQDKDNELGNQLAPFIRALF